MKWWARELVISSRMSTIWRAHLLMRRVDSDSTLPTEKYPDVLVQHSMTVTPSVSWVPVSTLSIILSKASTLPLLILVIVHPINIQVRIGYWVRVVRVWDSILVGNIKLAQIILILSNQNSRLSFHSDMEFSHMKSPVSFPLEKVHLGTKK